MDNTVKFCIVWYSYVQPSAKYLESLHLEDVHSVGLRCNKIWLKTIFNLTVEHSGFNKHASKKLNEIVANNGIYLFIYLRSARGGNEGIPEWWGKNMQSWTKKTPINHN